MRAVLGTVAGMLTVVVLAGCSGADRTDASQAGKDLRDCSDSGCADGLAAYSDAVSQLPGVETLDLSYRAEQITAGASINGDLMVAPGTACADLEDDLGRLLWESQLPVSTVALLCYLPGTSGSDYERAGYSFLLKDAGELTDRWGPRGG